MTARQIYSRIVGSLLAAAVGMLMLMVQAQQPEDVGYIKPMTDPDPVAALVQAHRCWTQDGPVGVIPGHVIYDGRYLGARATGQALDAAFGKSSPLDPTLVQAFCK